MTTVPDLQAAHHAVGSVVQQVSDWDARTPCPDLTTGGVVRHLIGGDVMIAALLNDEQFDPRSVGEPGAERYRVAADGLAAALRQPGALEKTIMSPVGPASGGQMMVLRTVEHVVHGWDVAVSQGLPTEDLDALAAPLIGVSEQLLAQLAGVLAERRPFADSRPVAADAPALDRLVALLGRDPHWSTGQVAATG